MVDDLLTASEVGARLRLSRRTIYRWAEEGRIPCIKVGGHALRFSLSAVRAWLGSRPGAESVGTSFEAEGATARRSISGA